MNEQQKQIEQQLLEEMKKQQPKAIAVGVIIAIVACVIVWNIVFKGNKTKEALSSNITSNITSKPTNAEIVSYAQSVLDRKLNNPKYSYGTSNYTVIGTGLRYEIEGKVDNKNFYMIIQFTDDSYKTYDLISLDIK